jgi:hypothetical protein
VLSIARRPAPNPASTLDDELRSDIDDMRRQLADVERLAVHTAKALELLLIDVNAARRDLDSLFDVER